MASDLLTLADIIVANIEAERTRVPSWFPYTGFTVARDHVPKVDSAADATQAGLCWIIGNLNDDSHIMTRGSSKLCERICMIQLAYQQSNIVHTEKAKLDTLVELEEKLREIIRKPNGSDPLAQNQDYPPINDSIGCTLLKIECLKDNDGVPFHYYMIREGNIFEIYFTAHFKITKS